MRVSIIVGLKTFLDVEDFLFLFNQINHCLMLVERMTIEEIYRELHRDFYDIIAYADRNNAKYLKLAKDRKVFPIIFKAINYKSRSNNSYYIVPSIFTKKQRDKKDVSFFPIATFFYRGGFAAATLTSSDSDAKLVLYTPHLFRRYRERFLKNEEISNLDLILHFFMNNNVVVFKSIPSSKYGEKAIASTIKDGILFGYTNGIAIMLKTFISFDNLYQNQTDLDDTNYLKFLIENHHAK